MNKTAFSLFKITFGIILTWLITTVLFFSNWDYAYKKTFLLSNILIVSIAIVLFISGSIIYSVHNKSRFESKNRLDLDKIVLIITAVLFLGQCYVCYNIFFMTNWDVLVVLGTAQDITSGAKGTQINLHYFSTYPNNLFITYFQVIILKINNWLGIFNNDYFAMCIVVVNCLINSVACLLVYKTAKIFTGCKYAFVAFCFAVLSFGISSWSVICYSDSLALFVPILSIYLYCKPGEKRYTRAVYLLGAMVVSMVGYFIKPQCAIVGIAILFIEFIRLLGNFSVKKIVRPVAVCLMAVITVSCVNLIIGLGNKMVDMQIDENRKLGFTHFLMMGANESTNGSFWEEDVLFSQSFSTPEERSEANLNVAKQRIQDRGIGFLGHIQKKMLTTFNDGTFAWGQEGNFYLKIPDAINNKMSPFLRSIYYNSGVRYPYLSTLQHFVWIVILCFSFFSVFLKKDFKYKSEISVLWITILGFVLYEILFEVRARYLYIFVPVFCVLAIIGIQSTFRFVLKGIARFKTRFLKGKS